LYGCGAQSCAALQTSQLAQLAFDEQCPGASAQTWFDPHSSQDEHWAAVAHMPAAATQVRSEVQDCHDWH